MAFQAKVDYCGLASVFDTELVVRDSNLGGSNEKYQPQGQDGSYLATEVYGEDTNPSNNYGLKAKITATAGELKLGKVVTQDNKQYMLESVSISTAPGSAPTVSAKCKQVETGCSDASCSHYEIPAFTLDTKQRAQILFSAFTLTGTGCSLTGCDANIACNVGKAKVAGTIIASDVSAGIITVSGTILQTGATAPTIAAAEGWIVTKVPAPTESNGETSYKTYSFEVEKILTKTEPSS